MTGRPTSFQTKKFLALALEPRIMFDAAAAATAEAVAVAATDTAPGVTATPAHPTVALDDTTTTGQVDLFSDVTVSADSGNQSLDTLVITVDRTGSNQALIIDGATITLENGANGDTAKGYMYSVASSGGTTTITVTIASSDYSAASDVTALIDSIAYKAQDNSVESGTVTVTLKSLSDSGGETANLGISAAITVANDKNLAPVLDSDPTLQPIETVASTILNNATEVVYSDDGDFAYAAGQNSISVFSVGSTGELTLVQTLSGITDMGTVTSMTISADGKSIYTISGGTSIVHLNVAEDGTVSYGSTVATSNGNATGSVAISDDGTRVYVGTQYNDVAVFIRDTTSGALTYLNRLDNSNRNGIVAISGDYIYVVYSGATPKLVVYERGDDGSTAVLTTLTLNTTTAADISFSTSQDGQYLYIGNPATNSISVIRFSGGELTTVQTVSVGNFGSMSLSGNGNTVYAATSTGTIIVYDVAADGTLNQSATLAGSSTGKDIAVSGDSLSILVAGGSVIRYSTAQNLNLGEATNFADGVTIKDSNYDALNSGAGNYNGASITVTPSASGGSFGLVEGNGLTLSNGVVSQNGTPIASMTADGDGKLTVTFTADVTTAVANQVLQQLTYTTTAAAAGSLVTLTVQGSDAALTSNSVTLTLRANNAPQVDTGTSSSYTLTTGTSEIAYSVVLPVGLFNDADSDTLSWSVSGLPAGLTFDPATRTISGSATEAGTFQVTVTVKDPYGASTSLTLSLVVDQIDNRAPAANSGAPTTLGSAISGTAYGTTLDSTLFTDADSIYPDSTLTWSVTGLPDGLSFDAATRTISGTATAISDYTVTVTVTDEHGASASTQLTLRVITQAEADNRAPTLGGTADAITYTSNGTLENYPYYVFSITVSDDGGTVTVVGNSSANATLVAATGGTSIVSIYSRDADTGKLTLLQSFTEGTSSAFDGLNGAVSVEYSADGKYAYVAGRNAANNDVITVFSVNEDGTLTATGLSAVTGTEQIKQIVVSDDGNALYAVSSTYLYAYGVNEDGSLTALGSAINGNFGTAYSISVDGDGTVYVMGDSRLTIYRANDDGSLAYAGQLTRSGTVLTYTDSSGTAKEIGTVPSSTSGLYYGRDMAVSADGTVYLVTGVYNYLTVLRYDDTGNTLTFVATSNVNTGQLGANPWGVALSADGTALYVGGGNSGKLAVYSINDDGSVTYARTIDIGARASVIAVSPDGSSIYTGGVYNATGISLIGTTDTVNASYVEGQTTQILADVTLADADYDALNNGAGNYNGATLTLVRTSGADGTDGYGLAEGNGLTLADGKILLNGAEIGTLTSTGGVLTVAFTADVTTAIASQVLRQITYTNASNSPGTTIAMTLSVKDQYTSDSIALKLTVTELNDAPVVAATPVSSAAYSEDSNPVTLFSDTAVSTVESGQTVTSLTFTVAGVADGGSESLTIDGTSVALTAGSGTTTTGYAYTVTVSGGTATIVISSSAGMAGADAATLIAGVTYANAAATLTEGTRTITLSAVKDSGGTANGGQDTATPGIAATVLVQKETPTVGAETGSLTYADLINLTGQDGYTNLLEGIRDVASAGDQVYVIRTATVWDSGTFSEVTVSTLYVFQRASDGALTLTQTIESTAQSALTGAAEIQVSADGATVTVIGNDSVALFSRDSTTGALTSLGSFAADVVSNQGTISDVLAYDGHVYVTAGDSLLVFTRQGDTLTLAQTYSDAGDTGIQLDGANTLALSADGRFLIVGTSGGGTLASVFRVGTDGTLTFVSAAQGPDATAEQAYYTTTLTLSPDGESLYAIENDGSGYRLYVLSLSDDGILSPTAAIQLNGAASDVIVSPDGAAVFVIGSSSIGIYARADDGTLTLRQQVSSYGGANLGEVRGVALSADGTQLYVTGTFSWNDGLMVLDLTAASSTYTEDGSAVALLPDGTLADPQLDALNGGQGDYKGATITIERQNGGVDEDVFGFLEGNGLTFDSANGTILLNGQTIATFTQADGKLTVTFTASVNQADAQNVLRAIAYSNTSDDPTQGGTQASFTVTVNDGTGHTGTMTAEITLVGVNDAPIVTTTVLNPTYNAEGERVKLFDDTVIDTVEAGQDIWQVIITLDAAQAGDVLGVDGGKISLDQATSGTQTTATGLQYMVQISGGKTTVTLYLMREPAEAAQIIDSLTYGNTGDALSGTRTITLAVKEYADTNHTTTLSQQVTVILAAATGTNTAPILGGTTTIGYTEQAPAVSIAPAATVSDTQMDAFNGGAGNYDGAVLTVTLGSGSTSLDQLGFADGNGLTLENGSLKKDGIVIGTVTNANGVLTITFSDAAGTIPTTADVQNTLRQITYANGSDNPPASVAVNITLADQRGMVSDAATASIAITAVNDAPVLTQDPVAAIGEIDLTSIGTVAGLGTLTTATMSADGLKVYVADDRGAIALFNRNAETGALTYVGTLAAVDGLNGIGQIELSADGKSLYVLRADGNAIGCFSVGSDGGLTLQTILVDDYAVTGGQLYSIKDIVLSADGKNLYLVNSYNVVTFSRDDATGALTYAGAIEGSMWSAPYLWAPTDIATQGDMIFVVTGTTLIVYERDQNGDLSLLAYTQSGASSLSGLQQVTVSPDGSTIYVAGSDTISSFTLDTAAGTLTFQDSVTTGQSITDAALSADGLTLYVTLADGSLVRYATGGGEITFADSQSGLGGAKTIAVSDGGIIVIGDGMTTGLEQASSLTYVIGTTPVAFATDYALSDPELDAVGNYSGASISVADSTGQGSFGFTADSGLTLSGTTLSLNGETIATVTSVNGTLTITFTANVTAQTANLVLHGLTYANNSAANGTTANLSISLNDGQTSSESKVVGVSIIEINDAPTLTANPGTHTIDTADGGTVPLFSDTAIDTVESGQAIKSLTLTVSGVKDGASEVLVIDGTAIALTAGTTTTANGHIVTIAVTGGTATVTISNAAGIATADAKALVDGIAYKGAESTTLTAGQRIVTLTAVQDNGGTAEGGIDTTALSIAATINVVYVNDAPSLVTTPATDVSHTAGGTPPLLFGDTTIDSGETGQTIRTLTLTVSGLHDGDGDALVIDGTTVALTAGTVTTAHGLTVTVTTADGTATVTISKATGMTTADAKTVVDGIAYGNVANGTLSVGQRVVTLVSIQDNGGTADGGVDTTSLNLSTTIDIPDAAPVAAGSGTSLNATSGADFSAVLPETLFRHPNGDTLTWTVDGLPDGLSFDAATRTISGTATINGTSSLTVTATDSNGETAFVVLNLIVQAPAAETTGPSPVLDTGTTPVVTPAPVDAGGPPTAGAGAGMPPALPLTQGGMTGQGSASGTESAIASAPMSFLLPVGEQLSNATTLTSDNSASTETSFNRQGDTWVASVTPTGAAQTEISVRVPAEMLGTGMQLKLANGMPLPSWVRFDPATGQITVDARQLARLQQLRLQMQSRDADGTVRDTVLEIRPGREEASATGQDGDENAAVDQPAPQAEQQLGLVPGQPMRLDVPSGLLEEARALLASLAGLPANDTISANGSGTASHRQHA